MPEYTIVGTENTISRKELLAEDCEYVPISAEAVARIQDCMEPTSNGGFYRLVDAVIKCRRCGERNHDRLRAVDFDDELNQTVFECQNCMPQIGRIPHFRRERPVLPEFARDDECCYTVGVEMELMNHEDLNYRKLLSLFPHIEVHTDSSINSCHNPVEIVTTPLRWDNLSEIEDFMEAMHTGRYGRWEVGNNCGLHIHIGNFRNSVSLDNGWQHDNIGVELNSIQNIIGLYYGIQEELYDTILPHCRLNNEYCMKQDLDKLERLYDARDIREFVAIYQGNDITSDNFNLSSFQWQQYTDRNASSRYMGLNLQSWLYRGSIEFRFPPPCLKWDEIKHWIDFCVKLCQEANSTPCEPGDGPDCSNFIQTAMGDEALAFFLNEKTRYAHLFPGTVPSRERNQYESLDTNTENDEPAGRSRSQSPPT